MKVDLCKNVLNAMVAGAKQQGIKSGVAVIAVQAPSSKNMRLYTTTIGEVVETVRGKPINHYGKAQMKIAKMLSTGRSSGVMPVGAEGELAQTGGYVYFTPEAYTIYIAFDGGTLPKEMAVAYAGMAVLIEEYPSDIIPPAGYKRKQ